MSEFQKSGLLPSFEPGLFLDARKIVMLKLIRKWTFFFTKKKTKAAKGYGMHKIKSLDFWGWPSSGITRKGSKGKGHC